MTLTNDILTTADTAKVETLINALHKHVCDNKESPGGLTMVGLVRERLAREHKAWEEFDHFAGRIASYHKTVGILIQARSEWPDLFQIFTITVVPSSTPAKKPPLAPDTTADAIFGRMMSDAGEIERHREMSLALSWHNLNDKIQRNCVSDRWRPVVHCEMLILDWMRQQPTTLPEPSFYLNERYIGTSKPSCLLCAMFFKFSGKNVKTRATHRNVYLNWRVPDLNGPNKNQAGAAQRTIMYAMIDSIRQRTLKLLYQRIPVRRYDSVTSTSYLEGRRLADDTVLNVHESSGYTASGGMSNAMGDRQRGCSLGHERGGTVMVAGSSGTSGLHEVYDELVEQFEGNDYNSVAGQAGEEPDMVTQLDQESRLSTRDRVGDDDGGVKL